MTTSPTGTCQGCKTTQLLDERSRIGRHDPPINMWPVDPCPGSGRTSAETAGINRERRNRRRVDQVEKARADAAVMHDLIETKRPVNADWLARLLELALIDYCLRFPGYSFRYRRAWFFYDGGPRNHLRSLRSLVRLDVYCTFCRSLLYQRANRRGDYSVHTEDHTRICALRCLAGIAEPVGPGNHRLPVDVRQDIEDSP